MIHVWSYILSVRGLLKSIDLEFLGMYVIFWLTSMSQNGHTDMLHTPKYVVVEIHGFGCSSRLAVTFNAVLNQYLESVHHICRNTRCAEPAGICVELWSIRP